MGVHGRRRGHTLDDMSCSAGVIVVAVADYYTIKRRKIDVKLGGIIQQLISLACIQQPMFAIHLHKNRQSMFGLKLWT